MGLTAIGMSATRSLDKSSNVLSSTLEQIAAGKKNLLAKNNPAATVLSALLSTQLNSSYQAVRNNQESSNLLSVAEGALGSVSGALQGMRSLALDSANSGITSRSQTSANQAQLNGFLNTIQTVAGSTSYGGSQLLSGAKSITAVQTDTSGTLSATQQKDIVDLSHSSFQSVSGSPEIQVSFSGRQADQAEKAYVEAEYGSGVLASEEAFTVAGNLGKSEFSFAAGTSVSDMADAINAQAETTGINAYLINGGSGLRLASQEYGSDQGVKVTQTRGDGFAAAGQSASDRGQDLTVTVNGQRVTGDGLTVQVSDTGFTGTLEFSAGSSAKGADPARTTVAQQGYDADSLVNADAARSSTLDTSGSGMQLQTGTTASDSDRMKIGLPDMSLRNLGRVTVDGQEYSLADLYSGGSAALAKNPGIALKVIDQAIADVSSARSDIGAYQSNLLESTNNSLNVSIGNIADSYNSIDGVDIAALSTQLAEQKALNQLGLFAVQNVNTQQSLFLRLLTPA